MCVCLGRLSALTTMSNTVSLLVSHASYLPHLCVNNFPHKSTCNLWSAPRRFICYVWPFRIDHWSVWCVFIGYFAYKVHRKHNPSIASSTKTIFHPNLSLLLFLTHSLPFSLAKTIQRNYDIGNQRIGWCDYLPRRKVFCLERHLVFNGRVKQLMISTMDL